MGYYLIYSILTVYHQTASELICQNSFKKTIGTVWIEQNTIGLVPSVDSIDVHLSSKALGTQLFKGSVLLLLI